MKYIIGKKMPMTQIWLADEKVALIPIKVEANTISQIKSLEKDKYFALQIASGNRKEKNINKAQIGHFKKLSLKPSMVKEFRLKEESSAKTGQIIDISSFAENEIVDVVGISKGKGFQGVVKRHGFAGGNKSHGNKDQLRMPGSIGSMGQARVFKGVRMGGRMGYDQVTVKNLKIVKIDLENKLIYIAGAVPGAINSWITIKAKGEMKFIDKSIEKKEEEKPKEEKPKEEKPKEEKPKEEEIKKEEKPKEEEIKKEEEKK
jgi:large subunit ribosomal protein L3